MKVMLNNFPQNFMQFQRVQWKIILEIKLVKMVGVYAGYLQFQLK